MTFYVCRSCRNASRGALQGIAGAVACSSCGSGRVEVVSDD